MRIFGIIIFFLTIVGVRLFAYDPLTLHVVDLSTKKIFPKNGKISVIVTMTIVPMKEEYEPVRFISLGVEKKRADGQFENIRRDVACPCDHKCCGPARTLNKGDVFELDWDQMAGDCKRVGSGTYRFIIINRYSEAAAGYVYHGASEEFMIGE